jgi:hypothetical protein
MILRYLGLEQELIHEEYNISLVPSIGDMVWFDEAFYIEHIVWYPKEQMIQVYLTDEIPNKKKSKVMESTEPVVNLEHLREVGRAAKQALKETTELKRQVFSIRQYLRKNKEK